MAQKPTAEAGILYVVPTPVGNLDDMTVRAVNVLKEVDVILAEDTRTSGVLMKHFGIETRMQSHHKFNEHETAAGIAQRFERRRAHSPCVGCRHSGHLRPRFLYLCANAVVWASKWSAFQAPQPLFPRLSTAACHATNFALRDFCHKKRTVPHALPN